MFLVLESPPGRCGGPVNVKSTSQNKRQVSSRSGGGYRLPLCCTAVAEHVLIRRIQTVVHHYSRVIRRTASNKTYSGVINISTCVHILGLLWPPDADESTRGSCTKRYNSCSNPREFDNVEATCCVADLPGEFKQLVVLRTCARRLHLPPCDTY